MSVKSYFIRKQLKKKVGLIIACILMFICILLTSAALLLDDLSSLGNDKLAINDCGWQDIKGRVYREICDSDEKHAEDYCATAKAGKAWLIFEILSIAFALGACAMIGVKKEFVKYLLALCGILTLSGTLSWVSHNPICYSKHLEEKSLGPSPNIAIICSIIYWLAALAVSIKKQKGRYTLLKE
eukprot:659722_1